MAKLKFDRNIKISLSNDDRVEVPKDEIWKGTLIFGSGSSIEFKTIAHESFTNGISPNSILGGGYNTERFGFYRNSFQGSIVASSKEVSLA